MSSDEYAKHKEECIKQVLPDLHLEGFDKPKAEAKVRELYKRFCQLEEEVYDMDIKLRKQDWDIQELHFKCNDVKGRFIKPLLKKVYKAESAKLSKFEKTHDSDLARQPTLKVTKKYAVDHKDEDGEKIQQHASEAVEATID